MERIETRVVIINPISGSGRRADAGRDRVALASSVLASRGAEAEIVVAERPGHARELAEAALQRGVSRVVVWGGDGTVNEVASVLAFRDVSMAIVPGGSGNGLARELGVPLSPEAALALAVDSGSRVIDCGELCGRLFFNVAGLGLDAQIAQEFATHGQTRRGFRKYVEIAARELFRFDADEHAVETDGHVVRLYALVVAVANSRQYGNGALIAPRARLDDGRLDVVIVGGRSVWRTLVHVRRLFDGRLADVPGVIMTTATDIRISSTRPPACHVDGEPFVGTLSVNARVHAQALRVCAGPVPRMP